MLKVDMQVVRVAYNEGLRGFQQPGEDGLRLYREITDINPKGVGAEASPWLDAFSAIFGQ